MSAESDAKFMQEAIKEAKKGLEEGGIPIGAVLVLDDKVIARGHNRRVQENSMIKHGETDCFESTQRKISPKDLKRAVLYTTLSPCFMCAGTALLYGIGKVVIGENKTFMQSEEWLLSQSVDVVVLDNDECIKMMLEFIREKPALWGEDIGKTEEEILAQYAELFEIYS